MEASQPSHVEKMEERECLLLPASGHQGSQLPLPLHLKMNQKKKKVHLLVQDLAPALIQRQRKVADQLYDL